MPQEAPRRPRGESRRALRAVEAVETAAVPTATPPGGGRRFATAMRYGPTLTTVRTGVPGLPSADESQEPIAPPEPLLAATGGYPARVHRRSLGISHKIAAVAAVSGLALAAAYPNLGGEPAGEESVAQTAAPVTDVSVPKADGYEIVRSSLTSSFTEEQQLDHVMSASGGDVTKVDTGGVLAQPLDSVRITSPFGNRVDPVSGYGIVSHIGQDYGAQCGTPVKAAAAGTVVQSGWAGHSGNRVRVDHGNGLETTYNHNSSLSVAVGQKVERGDVVSAVGTTGNSTGCHLHFEVLVNGGAVDPAGWL